MRSWFYGPCIRIQDMREWMAKKGTCTAPWYFGHMMIKNWLFKAFFRFKSSVIVFAGTQKKNLELGYIKF